MCGIVGLININASARRIDINDLKGVRKAIKIQEHRGPDDTGINAFCFRKEESYSDDADVVVKAEERILDGVLGFNRLSIKDLSQAGHQPMVALNGKVILTFNGEIYNDKELRSELIRNEGYHFKSTTDTEVIMAMYLVYGFKETVKRLNGMFAIVIVDLRKGEIWIARDRYGIKPLYYTFNNGRIGLASELKCILQFHGFVSQLDMDAFNARLIFSRPSEKVLLKDVELVEPGCGICIRYGEEPKYWKYYDVDEHVRLEDKYITFEEAKEETMDIISKAVSRQMVSDVKVGCQLSAGIDSTLVSYFANKQKTDNLNDAVSIIDEKGVIGEEKYIDYVGQKLDLNLHKFTMEPDYFIQNYERMIWHNDAPVYQPFFICFMKLAERAKEYVTVLLSGEGSDEIAGGYNRFAMGVYQPFLSKLSGDSYIKAYKTYAEYAVMTDQTITTLISNGYTETDKLIQEQIERFDSFAGSNFNKHLKFEIYQRLPEALLRQDKMTMASSIENRVPLLDNEVVDYVMSLPENMLIRFASESPLDLSTNPLEWVHGKYIFKEIVAQHFGRDFAYRKKQIMALDKRTMVTSPAFREYFYDAVYPGMKRRDLLDAEYVRKMFDEATTINNIDFTSMWRAISLETWCQLFLERGVM